MYDPQRIFLSINSIEILINNLKTILREVIKLLPKM